jgi:galactose-1-phosphate uridylyltransferase
MVPFAPAGAREAVAVAPVAQRLGDLRDDQVASLAHGLDRVLTWYEDEGLSAFNFTLYGGPLDGSDPGFPVVLRVIARTAFKQDYRTDDYFLQKQLGGELMFAAPEEMAARLRILF